MQTWTYPSGSGLGDYTVIHSDNGLMSCNCRGWTIKRPGKPRECTHTKKVIEIYSFAREVRGDYVFASAPFTSLPGDDILIKKQGGEAMATTTTAAILEGMKASAIVEGRFPRLLDDDGFIIPAIFDATFTSDDWTMDEKLDGHRCLIRKDGQTITTPLRSVPLPAHIISVMRLLPDGVYDGELLVPGGVSTDVPNTKLRDELIYAMFDVLECNGTSTMQMTQAERRGVLECCIEFATGQSAVVVVAQYAPSWAAVEAVWRAGGEGVILKRKASRYRPGARSADWLKVKKLEQHAVAITGFEAGSGGPTAIMLFKFDDGTDGRCKTPNNGELAATAADPDAYKGRRFVVQCQQRMRGSKSPRHPIFDHWLERESDE
jgi:ATP dependent DNA ligase domain